MSTTWNMPREWREKIPAVVFAILRHGEIRLTVMPGVGMADGGYPWDVPLELVPFELRMSNTPLWLQCDEKMKVLRIWRREDDEA